MAVSELYMHGQHVSPGCKYINGSSISLLASCLSDKVIFCHYIPQFSTVPQCSFDWSRLSFVYMIPSYPGHDCAVNCKRNDLSNECGPSNKLYVGSPGSISELRPRARSRAWSDWLSPYSKDRFGPVGLMGYMHPHHTDLILLCQLSCR